MVMLDLLYKGGADLLVVHVNHRIRENSARDCEFVRCRAKKLNLPFLCFEFDVPELAGKSGRSIETEARLVRRSVLDGLISSHKADVGAFAHHADDNAETVLMHILRGSGVDGLCGITESDRIIRPLIDMTREQIEEYALKNGIDHVEDETNSDIKYMRNFIRHEVLPLIKTRYPRAVSALNRLAQNARWTMSALDGFLDKSLISTCGNAVMLDIEALSSPLSFRYVITSAKMLMPVDVTRAQIEGVIRLRDSQNGKMAELAGGLKAYREYDKITFCFDESDTFLPVPFAEGRLKAGGTTISVKRVLPVPQQGKTIVGYVPDGAVFRSRTDGDRFTPYGGKEKSLKKYLIDKKIPGRVRDSLVLLAKDDVILAIVGVEIADSVKIQAGAKNAYLIEAEKRGGEQ